MKKVTKPKKTLAVVGLGYVGLPLAALAASKGYKVIGIDINSKKVKMVNKGKPPFVDEELEEVLKKVKINATTEYSEIKNADIVVICVPTPVNEDRHPNYEPVKDAVKSVSPFLTKGSLVILESTVNPGVCDEIVIPLIEKTSKFPVGEILLAHCPERINPGDKNWNVSNIPRVVGGFNKESLDKAYKFYRSILSASVRKMNNLKEAEAVKVVENSFRNINIAFVNELAQSFSKLGIDVVNVIEGASTKPFAFMPHFPGCGVGGHCIPVDPYYLIDYAKKNGYSHKFLSLACKVNEHMPDYTVELFKQEMEKQGKRIEGSNVTVLGLSYKADIDDTRESPSYDIINRLKKYGVNVRSFDPYVANGSKTKDLNDALQGSEAVIVATNHKEFLDLKPKKLLENNIKILIDGRNCLVKEDFTGTGIIYRGIGR